MMVLMALLTTLLTSPLLAVVYPQRFFWRERREPEPASQGLAGFRHMRSTG